MTKALNIREYWDIVGTDIIDKIIDQIGSSKAVFRQMRYGLKRCSEERADLIIEAARKYSPGFEPNRKKLIKGAPIVGVQAKIHPSKGFLASRKSNRPKVSPEAAMRARKSENADPEEVVMASSRARKARARAAEPTKATSKPPQPRKGKTMTQETPAKPLKANPAPTPQTATDRAMAARSSGPVSRIELTNQALAMKAGGKSSTQIAAILGLHRSTIDRMLAGAKPAIKSTGHHHDPDA